MKIVIFGAGSVGAHYSRAWSKLTKDVTLVDIDADALERIKNQTWPERYGQAFPQHIKLLKLADFSWNLKFQVAVIGTPPSSHSTLLESLIEHKTAETISIQKPVSTPRSADIMKHVFLEKRAAEQGIHLVSGYNHRYSKAFTGLLEAIGEFGRSENFEISVNWNESWDGIMKAHPWLSSPKETYLGSTMAGGGASFEHSHGLDLGLFTWQALTQSKFDYLEAIFSLEKEGNFDEEFLFYGRSTNGKMSLKVSQDVKALEVQKKITVALPTVIISVEFSKDLDTLEVNVGGASREYKFSKNRETDFDSEVEIVKRSIQNPELFGETDTLSFHRALNTSILGTFCVQKFWYKEGFDESLQLLKSRFICE